MTCGDVMANGSDNVSTNNLPATRSFVDLTAGHCFPPVPVVVGSPNVSINNIPAARVGDPHSGHCCGKPCHGGAAASGSPNVSING